MLTVQAHREVLRSPAGYLPLSESVFAATAAGIVTTHTISTCDLAATATATYTAGDLHTLGSATIAGCPVCGSSGLVDTVGEVLGAVRRTLENCEELARKADDGEPWNLARLRAALDPHWAFAAQSVISELRKVLVRHLPRGSVVAGVAAERWVAELLDLVEQRCAQLLTTHPCLVTRTPGENYVVVSSTLATGAHARLWQTVPVRSHPSEERAPVVFALDAQMLTQAQDNISRGLRTDWLIAVEAKAYARLDEAQQWPSLLLTLSRLGRDASPRERQELFDAAVTAALA